MIGLSRKMAIRASAFAATLCLCAPAFAQSEEEMDILQMIYRDKDLVTPTRSPKPISQVAENVTVVTAEEIEAINAHTLTDVLYHVTGVQMDIRGGPGSGTAALIQGSDPRHVQVMVDGVSLNNLADNFADIGAFPVRQIERVEIVKGPASSAWGSSLGGIINIVTRSPDPTRRMGGAISASIGERSTGDFRADASGTAERLGYYLYGGGLTSDGLTPNTPFDAGNLYGKLQFLATERIKLQYTLGYTKGARGNGEAEGFGFFFSAKERFERFLSTLTLNYVITDDLNLDLSGRVFKQHVRRTDTQISLINNQISVVESAFDDTTLGGSAKVNWRSGRHNLLAGMDYDDGTLDSNVITDERQEQEKWAIFANDTVTLGDFSVTPGIRYDHTSTNDDFVSPSLGITYAPTEQTIIRGYVARGFNTPPLSYTFGGVFPNIGNPALGVEKVWSYSLGVETALLGYAWFKTTGFIHEISDVIIFEPQIGGTLMAVNHGRQRRQGVEVEVKTVQLYNTSLLAGFGFIDAKDRETHRQILGIPRYTCDLGIDYEYNKSLWGALRGHYISWNADPGANSKDRAVIWDLNLTKKVLGKNDIDVDLFFTVHNLFNGSQYSLGFFPNPRRWLEGGVKVKF